MTGREFSARGAAILRGRGWKSKLARGMGKDLTTVRRWANGGLPVPAYAVATLELLEALPRGKVPQRFL